MPWSSAAASCRKSSSMAGKAPSLRYKPSSPASAARLTPELAMAGPVERSITYREDRYLLLGTSSKYRLLVVSYCYRDDDLVRIISARKALSQERLNYLIR
ncbi:MAG: BrnT family toxin [Duganella sp.]